MGFQIEDGTGDSYQAGVDKENRLKVSSIAETKEHIINHEFGKAYSFGFNDTPDSTGSCFLYIKNEDEDDMVVSEFMLDAASDETITIKLGDIGTPVGGSPGTLGQRNAGSGNIANVTALYGVNITGISGGWAVMSVFLKGGETSVRRAPLSSFIIPKNKVIAAYVTTGGIKIKLGMGISFHDSATH